MITRRSLFGLTFGGAVSASTAKLAPAEYQPEIVADAGVLDLELRDVRKRLRFEADRVRTKADV